MLRAGEIASMRGVQNAHMMDECVILAYSSVPDGYNLTTDTWTAGSPIACGVRHDGRREAMDDAEVVIADATIRLPIGTTIDRLDRLRVTKRHGVAIEPVTYAIIGIPKRGATGLRITAREVTE